MTVVAAKIVCASSPVMKIEPTLEGKNEICISFYSNQNFKIVSYDHKLIVGEVESNITKPVSRKNRMNDRRGGEICLLIVSFHKN